MLLVAVYNEHSAAELARIQSCPWKEWHRSPLLPPCWSTWVIRVGDKCLYPTLSHLANQNLTFWSSFLHVSSAGLQAFFLHLLCMMLGIEPVDSCKHFASGKLSQHPTPILFLPLITQFFLLVWIIKLLFCLFISDITLMIRKKGQHSWNVSILLTVLLKAHSVPKTYLPLAKIVALSVIDILFYGISL